MGETINSILVREDISPAVKEKGESLSPRTEYISIVKDEYAAREQAFDSNLSVTRRLHSMASKLWNYFSSPDQETRAKAEDIFENDKVLLERKALRDEAEANIAVNFAKERGYAKIKPVEKKNAKEEVKIGNVKSIVDNMIAAKAQWINLHFEGDTNKKETVAKLNRLNTYQQDSIDKIKQVYGDDRAYFDYKTNELQKTMLEGRLHEYFGTADSMARGNMGLVLSTVLDYPSYNLVGIMGNNELSIEEKVAEAMKFNKQDGSMAYLKSQIKSGYLPDNSES
jgi:hypothetical protein